MKKVLIAEDNMDLREIFSRAFDLAHFDVQAASNGRIALDMLDSLMPDVLVLDINMPQISGLEVLSRIRSSATLKHMKVIVVTGNNVAAQSEEAALADLFLIKPIGIHELVTFANRLLDKPH